jgi:hypothetical protein
MLASCGLQAVLAGVMKGPYVCLFPAMVTVAAVQGLTLTTSTPST